MLFKLRRASIRASHQGRWCVSLGKVMMTFRCNCPFRSPTVATRTFTIVGKGRGYCLQGGVRDRSRGGQWWCGAAMMLQWWRIMAWNNFSQRSGIERIKHRNEVSLACNYGKTMADGKTKQTATDGEERHFQRVQDDILLGIYVNDKHLLPH